VTKRVIWLIPLIALLGLADSAQYVSVKRKLDEIDAERMKPGTRVTLTPPELRAYAEHEMPAGVRNPAIQLSAGTATGTALVDFARLRTGQGHPPGWIMSHLLEGERPVSVTASIRSANGRATVDVEKVVISGLQVDGRTLDFLVQNVLLPLYPDAAVGRPFELGHKIDRLDVQPGAVHVLIGR
jgi:hypothetical protein